MGIRNPNEEEKMLKKQVEELARNCRAKLLLQQPFIGMLIMQMEIKAVVDSRMTTAATDGKRIFLDAQYFKKLNPGYRLFLLAHEVWHCVLQHFSRLGDRDRKRFNYAADLEVNFILEDAGFDVIEFLSYEDDWRRMSAEYIYSVLPESLIQEMPVKDQHIYEKDKTNEAFSPVSKNEMVIDPDYKPSVSKTAKEEWKTKVYGNYQKLLTKHGTIPGYLKQIIDSRFKPKLNWKEILQQFVTMGFGGERKWLPPNRRYVYRGLYLPSVKEEILSIIVALDTSGSMTCVLEEFLNELKGIVQSFGRYIITLITCDAEIHSVKEYSESKPLKISDLELEGGGGTSFIPVFDYIEKNVTLPRLLIYLTDGEGEVPIQKPGYPVLWVIPQNCKIPVEWGMCAIFEMNENSYPDF